MTGDEQTVLNLVGSAGGRLKTDSASLSALGSSVSSAIVAGWLVQAGDYYLMGTVGEKALASALAPGS